MVWGSISPAALHGYLSHNLHGSSSLLLAERATSDGKAIGLASDVPGLHLPSGGRPTTELGKPGCGDLQEAGDSGGGYWVSMTLD